MDHVKRRRKYAMFDCMIWKKSKVDKKGRCVLPKKLRQKLDLNGHSSVLWISAKQKLDLKKNLTNEYILEIGVENV